MQSGILSLGLYGDGDVDLDGNVLDVKDGRGGVVMEDDVGGFNDDVEIRRVVQLRDEELGGCLDGRIVEEGKSENFSEGVKVYLLGDAGGGLGVGSSECLDDRQVDSSRRKEEG